MPAAVIVVLRRPGYGALGFAAFVTSAVFFLWSSQVLTLEPGGIAFLPDLSFISASLAMALLFSLVLPMQVFGFRVAATAARTTGGTLLGVLVGTASMSCCAPVVLPAILSLLGFSGTTLLSLTGLFHHYWLPLATLSIILLGYSLVSTASIVEPSCRPIARARREPSAER